MDQINSELDDNDDVPNYSMKITNEKNEIVRDSQENGPPDTALNSDVCLIIHFANLISYKNSRNSGSKRPKRLESGEFEREIEKEKRKTTRDHQRVIAAYYSDGTSHGSPTTNLLYTMASQLGRHENDLLW